jgi:ABC-type Co2+ transport system permease subunit
VIDTAQAHGHLGRSILGPCVIIWSALALLVLDLALLIMRHLKFTTQQLNTAALLIAASFAIFQVNLPFAAGDLAYYNAHTERVRR